MLLWFTSQSARSESESQAWSTPVRWILTFPAARKAIQAVFLEPKSSAFSIINLSLGAVTFVAAATFSAARVPAGSSITFGWSVFGIWMAATAVPLWGLYLCCIFRTALEMPRRSERIVRCGSTDVRASPLKESGASAAVWALLLLLVPHSSGTPASTASRVRTICIVIGFVLQTVHCLQRLPVLWCRYGLLS